MADGLGSAARPAGPAQPEGAEPRPEAAAPPAPPPAEDGAGLASMADPAVPAPEPPMQAAGSSAAAGDSEAEAEAREIHALVERSSRLLGKAEQAAIARLLARVPRLVEGQDALQLRTLRVALQVQIAHAEHEPLLSAVLDQTSMGARKSPPVRIALGLGSFFYLALAAGVLLSVVDINLPSTLAGIDLRMVALCAGIGGLGSMVSLMTRIQSFEALRGSDRWVPVFIGLFRPIIGLAFGIFTYFMIASGVLAIGPSEEVQRNLFILALCFVAGFSERFVPDLVARMEGQVRNAPDGAPTARAPQG